ncbi:hypothetical protein CPB84DRAFT_1853829 [Gymnopilus junonius]|uniref:Uncharacterized protein n=1 Tax=Gymnopilus junonius TaxID=109634 RepID=A0A9P5N879_GYMJU|nr:hypothetical protein CPB84DRAFT_1853829 [Gymnopilus junonius]
MRATSRPSKAYLAYRSPPLPSFSLPRLETRSDGQGFAKPGLARTGQCEPTPSTSLASTSEPEADCSPLGWPLLYRQPTPTLLANKSELKVAFSLPLIPPPPPAHLHLISSPPPSFSNTSWRLLLAYLGAFSPRSVDDPSPPSSLILSLVNDNDNDREQAIRRDHSPMPPPRFRTTNAFANAVATAFRLPRLHTRDLPTSVFLTHPHLPCMQKRVGGSSLLV